MKTTMRRLLTELLVLTAVGAGDAAAQSCENPRPTLGIGTYHCQGGSCLVSGSSATMRSEIPREAQRLRQQYPFPYSFTVEPRLWRIQPDGPAAGKVRDGDLLIAVDGAPITTQKAALSLTTMKPGDERVLTLRRDGRMVHVQLEVAGTCGSVGASAGPDEMPWTLEQDREAPVPLAPNVPEDVGLVRLERVGLALAGAKHIEVDEHGEVRWWFEEVPVIAEVAEGGPADRAGILAGEELVTVGGEWVTEPEGAAALAALRPGDGTTVIVRRGNSARGVEIDGS